MVRGISRAGWVWARARGWELRRLRNPRNPPGNIPLLGIWMCHALGRRCIRDSPCILHIRDSPCGDGSQRSRCTDGSRDNPRSRDSPCIGDYCHTGRIGCSRCNPCNQSIDCTDCTLCNRCNRCIDAAYAGPAMPWRASQRKTQTPGFRRDPYKRDRLSHKK